jgi:UPF0755 protein
MKVARNMITAVIVITLLLVAFGKLYNLFNLTQNTQEVFVTIEKGSSLREISKELKSRGVINSSDYFILYTKLKGMEKSIKAGKYSLPPQIKLGRLLEEFQKPKEDYVVVTIPEGYTLYQIASELEENNLVNKSEFLKTAKKISTYDKIVGNKENIYYKLEGYLFPDTYYVPEDFTEEEIIKMMFERFREKFTDDYEKRAEELGLSLNEVMVIASLIEKEAANDEERNTIAGVIYNRIEKGMPLQIDASVIYGITKGKGDINRVSYSDLQVESVYNTYKYKGLPPGPIASPGQASIEAALYPEQHDYLYYVLGEKGHVFSKNYNDHLQNIKKYKNK